MIEKLHLNRSGNIPSSSMSFHHKRGVSTSFNLKHNMSDEMPKLCNECMKLNGYNGLGSENYKLSSIFQLAPSKNRTTHFIRDSANHKVVVPPIEFKNELIKNNAKEVPHTLPFDENSFETTLNNSFLQNTNIATKPIPNEAIDVNDDMYNTQMISLNSKPQSSIKEKVAIKNQIRQKSSTAIDQVNSEPKPTKKYTKFINELTKLEEKFDKHDIQQSISVKTRPGNFDDMLKMIDEEHKYINSMFSEITTKYDNSELNSFKLKMTKGKQSSESQVIQKFYILLSRVIESLNLNREELQKHHTKVIESKDFKIGDLDTRLYNAHAQLERIEKDRIRLKKDVELELSKLDELGSLDQIQKPPYITGEEELRDPNQEDPVFTLNDIHQFLLFEGEIAKSDPFLKNVKINYKNIEKVFTANLEKIQKVTANRVIKRIHRNITTEDKG